MLFYQVVEKFLEIALVAIVIILAYHFQKRKIFSGIKGLSIIILLGVFSAWIANVFVDALVALPTDEIVVTALAEKNADSKKDEIYLTGLFVDDQEVELQLKNEKNAWFWQASYYVWRNEKYIAERPEQISESITLLMPWGKDRRIEFFTNQYKGMVCVSENSTDTVVDCYSAEDNGRISYQLADSSTIAQSLYSLYRVMVFAVIFLLLYWGMGRAAKSFWYSKKTAANFVRSKQDILLFSAIAIILLLISREFLAFSEMVWRDDMYGIGSSLANSLSDVLKHNLLQQDGSPPLFNIVAYLWTKILPSHGEVLEKIETIYLLPQLLLASASVVMGLVGKELAGRRGGLLLTILTASSAALIMSTGFEFRPYSLFLLNAAIAWLIYIKRVRQGLACTSKLMVAQCLAFIVLLYTHYFAIFMIGIFFLSDLVLIIKKKYTNKHLCIYVISFLSELLWFFVMTTYRSSNGEDAFIDSWKGVPKWIDIARVWNYLLDDSSLLWIVALCTIIGLGYVVNKRLEATEAFRWQEYLAIVSVLALVGTVIGVFIFSQWYPLFTARYFVFLFPFAGFLILYGIETGLKFASDCVFNCRTSLKFIYWVVAILIIMNSGQVLYHDMTSSSDFYIVEGNIRTEENYAEISETLQKWRDVNYSNTAVLYSGKPVYFEALKYLLDTPKLEYINLYYYNSNDGEYLEYDTLYIMTYAAELPSDTLKNDQELNAQYEVEDQWSEGLLEVVKYQKKE